LREDNRPQAHVAASDKVSIKQAPGGMGWNRRVQTNCRDAARRIPRLLQT